MRHRPTLLLLAATACNHVVDSPDPAARTPLIESVLIAGADLSRFRIRWLEPAGTEAHPPIPPEEFGLELVHPNGAHASWEPDPDSSGVYLATLPIVPLGAYRLGGTIGGRPIRAATRVPGPLDIEDPRGDTLFVAGSPSQGGSVLSGQITVRWRADGATVLALDSAAVRFSTGFTRAAETSLGIRQAAAGQRTGPTVRFVAMNRDSDRYHFNLTGPETNISGGFGVLGGAAEVRRVVVWR